MDHRKISKESWAPALTSSPLTSTAREENCAGRGDVKVLKLRYLQTQKSSGFCARHHGGRVKTPPRPHLCRSKARTVPSSEALTMTKPLAVKATLVTLLVCSVNVTKHRPLLVFHAFTCGDRSSQVSGAFDYSKQPRQGALTLLSSPPVTMYCPSGEYASAAMLLKWPCCLKTYDSLCHSHTRSWPIPGKKKKRPASNQTRPLPSMQCKRTDSYASTRRRSSRRRR